MKNRADIWRNDKTSFVLLFVFFVIAWLSQHWASPIAIYTQITILATMGFVFMLAFLCALAWRLGRLKRSLPRFWWPLLLAFSTLIWLIGMFAQGFMVYGYSLLSWQLLLIGGLVFGYYNPEITRWWESLRGQARWIIVAFLAAATVISWCTYTILLQQPTLVLTTLALFDPVHLGPALLLLFGAWLPLIYHVCHHVEAKLHHKSWL